MSAEIISVVGGTQVTVNDSGIQVSTGPTLTVEIGAADGVTFSQSVVQIQVSADAQVNVENPGVEVQLLFAGQGQQGIPGPPGGGGGEVNGLCAVSVLAGQPVYADQVTGQFKLATAAALTTSSVIGLMASDTGAGFVGPAQQLSISLADWTPIIGSAALAKGQIYFLATTAGMLTTVAPTVPGQAVTRIGIALTTQMMALGISPPILL